jgi:hypothetical protein
MGDCPLDQLTATYQWLQEKYGKITVVVIEDFRLFFKRARKQAGSNMPASRGIGALEALCDIYGAKKVVQSPGVKEIGRKFAGMKEMPANHAETHKFDAVVHGVYYMRGIGLIKTALQKQKERENGSGALGQD